MGSIKKRFGVIAGFVVLLALLALTTAILRRQLAIQVGNQEWLSRSRRVVQELLSIGSLLKDAESGQRGYLYTGKLEYLAPYSLAVGQIDAHLKNLSAQIGDDPPQQANVSRLRVLIHQKLGELKETITFFQAGDKNGSRALVMSDEGFNLMSSIRRLIDQMEQEEISVGDWRRCLPGKHSDHNFFYLWLECRGCFRVDRLGVVHRERDGKA